jgi:heme/copper-type cytochrome/quinol oxidase subunit 2
MFEIRLKGDEFLEMIKILFIVSLVFALLIIFIFHHYRNKYLTLTK